MMKEEQIRALVLGHAVGDALGVPVEFQDRASLAMNPVLGMRSGGSHHMPRGCWSDDTSMTLALMDSIASTGAIQVRDIMTRFSQWFHQNAYTATQRTFGVGRATELAIKRFDAGTEPTACGSTEAASNGNGSLMRISPIAFYLHERYAGQLDTAEPLAVVHVVSALTHGHCRSQMACGIYVILIGELLDGKKLHQAVAAALQKGRAFYAAQPGFIQEVEDTYSRLWRPDFAGLGEADIRSTGYVVDTLEAVLWCLLTTSDYKSCVLKAVNLGFDTDTIGAISGGIAALAYGEESIPEAWLDALLQRTYMETLCHQFANARKA